MDKLENNLYEDLIVSGKLETTVGSDLYTDVVIRDRKISPDVIDITTSKTKKLDDDTLYTPIINKKGSDLGSIDLGPNRVKQKLNDNVY